MKSIPISVFKAHALEMIDTVSTTREGVIITKRGKPVAQVIPYRESTAKPRPGKLSGYLVFEKDIVTPLDAEMWEVTR